MDSAAGTESESESESESDAVTDLESDLCADWESGSGTGEEFNTESESGGLRFGLAEIGVKVEIGVGGSHALGRNQSQGQIRSQTLSHGLALHLGHAMALHFVVECDMTRYIVVCCVVAGHDIHDMAWHVVARDVEFYAAWTQPNRLRAWTQPKTYAWKLRSRTQSKSGFESNSETTAELGI